MKQYSIIIFLFLFISGCTKELKINFDEPSHKIVLYPILNNSKEIIIKMSGPASILSNNFPILENGNVIISDNDVPVDTIYMNEKGNGYSKIIPLPNHKYTFRATAKGYPEAVCEAQLPNQVETFKVDTTHVFFNNSKCMKAQLRIKDDPNTINYYKATLYSKQSVTTTVIHQIGASFVTYDSSFVIILKPQLYANITDQGFFSIWSGRFLLAQDVIDFGDGSNFRYKFGSELYFQGTEFYFSDDLFNGKEIILNIIVGGSILSLHPEKYIIELSSISQDYYLGVKSYARYGTKENANLPVSEEVSIYSAVTGGYGFPIASTTVIDSSYWKVLY